MLEVLSKFNNLVRNLPQPVPVGPLGPVTLLKVLVEMSQILGLQNPLSFIGQKKKGKGQTMGQVHIYRNSCLM